MGIWTAVRKIREKTMRSGFRFGRSLVLLQSDDWGRVGVHDEEGREQLRASGLSIGESPYDFYSLETAEDVGALTETLESLKDSVEQSACLEMNFVTANIDFSATSICDSGSIKLKRLIDGLPGNWSRPGLYESYLSGIEERVLMPALHGASHFCQQAVCDVLSANDQRADLLRTWWKAETPYIYWRMPWVGYEYWNPNRKPAERFISEVEQRRWIDFAAKSFQDFFGNRAVSACAPGYRANKTTMRAWKAAGVAIVQSGPGAMRAPHLDDGLLHIYRSIDFEPALNSELRPEDVLARARECFVAGLPFIISVHSINFHSTLAPFRQKTIPLLKSSLEALTTNFPDLLFVTSKQLLEIIETGGYETSSGRIEIAVCRTGRTVGA